MIVTGKEMVVNLEEYEVATAAVRRAIEDPNAEIECFAEVLPNIQKLNNFYSFSEKLASVMKDLIERLAQDRERNMFEQETTEALAKKYAELVSVIIEWDFKKMVKSNLQNDLAFYRRCMDRQAANHELPVNPDATTHISMMLAQALPMLHSVCAPLRSTARNNPNICSTLGKLAESCRYLIEKSKFPEGSPYYRLCLEAMAGSIVIYDNISPGRSAFKSKDMRVDPMVKLIGRKWPQKHPDQVAIANQLKNLIQYGAPNFNDDASKKCQSSLS